MILPPAASDLQRTDAVPERDAALECPAALQPEKQRTTECVAASEVVDPTGCGDAFRGALLFGLERGWALERCVALGNRLGALKIASRGGQNHAIDAATLIG